MLCVAGLRHIPVSMAGASTKGAWVASRVELTTSSARPTASRAKVEAVVGTTRWQSAQLLRSM